MCLAILAPAGRIVPPSNLHEGWIRNPDGAGFAYTHNGKTLVRKGFMLWKDFIEAYDVARKKYSKSNFLIHFRIRSMGDKSEENTHPFPIPGGALIHNGTIDGTEATYGKGRSDTFFFSETYGEALQHATLTEHKKDFNDALGYGNKVAILYDDGRYCIINEVSGHWEGDVWYSNYSFRKVGPAPYLASQGMGMMGMEDWDYATGIYRGD